MVEVIEVKDDIATVLATFQNGIGNLDELERALAALDGLLATDLWKGEAKDKCVQIHGLLKRYEKDIRELIEKIQKSIQKLQSNTESFPTDSDSLKSIASI